MDNKPANIGHLRELKKNLDTHNREQQEALLVYMKKEIASLRQELADMRGEFATLRQATTHLRGDITAAKSQISEQRLAHIDRSTMQSESGQFESGQLKLALQLESAAIYKNIIREVNTKIMPRINDTIAYMHYNIEDPLVAINNYRYSLDKNNTNKAICDGTINPRLFLE
jgi:DNA repair exonuclease SbcCD ATPase subunit